MVALRIAFFIVVMFGWALGDDNLESEQGFLVALEQSSALEGVLKISGEFSIFVNCGSQYAIWDQFPDTVEYSIKDLDSGEVFKSVSEKLSISWDGNDIYEHYSNEPCDQVVTKAFSATITDINFLTAPSKTLTNVELYARYEGIQSNMLSVKNFPLALKRFKK
ncbi:hypothetical protein KO489_01300 [Reinekea forsetii]|nr:hypothetical protein [Reinekea forsetii]